MNKKGKKWAYGREIYGANKWKSICDRLNIDARNAYASDIHLIIALKDIPKWDVKIGDIGGFVPKIEHLPQNDDSWVWGSNTMYRGNGATLSNGSLLYWSPLTTSYGGMNGCLLNDGRAHTGCISTTNDSNTIFDFKPSQRPRPWNNNRFWLYEK